MEPFHVRKQSGFTLIELLVVVAIIALLVSILLPSLREARTLAEQSVCASNLHQLGVGTVLFAHDHNGLLFRHPSLAVTQTDGWDNNTVTNLWTKDPEKVSFLPYFSNMKEFFYCPSYPAGSDTPYPWPGTSEVYIPSWGFPLGGGFYGVVITYANLCNINPVNPADLEYVAKKVTDDPSLGIWTDASHYQQFAGDGWWISGNHPAMSIYAGMTNEVEGRNLLRLGGDVSWAEFTTEMKHRMMLQANGFTIAY